MGARRITISISKNAKTGLFMGSVVSKILSIIFDLV
jgi:hypothetical protein